MLALTRKVGQSIVIGDRIEITVVEVKGDQIRLGIKAPKEVSIYRKEIYDEIQAENQAAADLLGLSPNDLDGVLSEAVEVTKKHTKKI